MALALHAFWSAAACLMHAVVDGLKGGGAGRVVEVVDDEVEVLVDVVDVEDEVEVLVEVVVVVGMVVVVVVTIGHLTRHAVKLVLHSWVSMNF